MGVHGIDEVAGFTRPNLMEAETNRALMSTARAADRPGRPHQVGRRGALGDRRLHEASVLVSDDGLGSAARQMLREQVGELIVVPVEGTGANEEEE